MSRYSSARSAGRAASPPAPRRGLQSNAEPTIAAAAPVRATSSLASSTEQTPPLTSTGTSGSAAANAATIAKSSSLGRSSRALRLRVVSEHAVGRPPPRVHAQERAAGADEQPAALDRRGRVGLDAKLRRDRRAASSGLHRSNAVARQLRLALDEKGAVLTLLGARLRAAEVEVDGAHVRHGAQHDPRRLGQRRRVAAAQLDDQRAVLGQRRLVQQRELVRVARHDQLGLEHRRVAEAHAVAAHEHPERELGAAHHRREHDRAVADEGGQRGGGGRGGRARSPPPPGSRRRWARSALGRAGAAARGAGRWRARDTREAD